MPILFKNVCKVVGVEDNENTLRQVSEMQGIKDFLLDEISFDLSHDNITLEVDKIKSDEDSTVTYQISMIVSSPEFEEYDDMAIALMLRYEILPNLKFVRI